MRLGLALARLGSEHRSRLAERPTRAATGWITAGPDVPVLHLQRAHFPAVGVSSQGQWTRAAQESSSCVLRWRTALDASKTRINMPASSSLTQQALSSTSKSPLRPHYRTQEPRAIRPSCVRTEDQAKAVALPLSPLEKVTVISLVVHLMLIPFSASGVRQFQFGVSLFPC